MNPQPLLLQNNASLDFEEDKGLVITNRQDITDEFLSELADHRAASTAPAGDFHLVASIPTAVADRWLAEGFDVYKEPVTASLARLRRENMGRFIATGKRI